jgi:hypothetical protein
MSVKNLIFAAAGQVGGEYQISRSLRFNSADSAYLSRTPASASNRKTWTWSGWVKRSALGATQVLFGAGPSGTRNRLMIGFLNTDVLNFDFDGVGNFVTTAVYRDVSAWYHIVFVVDTTQATGRAKIYVNNSEVFSGLVFNLNEDTPVNNSTAHEIGRDLAANNYFNGYMTEINFIDGQALTPSSFGETNETTGVWSPIAYAGSYGTNGFYLNFSDNSGVTSTTLGKDQAGSNNWTPNNFSVTAGAGNDSLVDTPTQYGTDTGAGGEVRGNYCTANPLDSGGVTCSNGNLKIAFPTNGQYNSIRSTIGISTGKWYWEAVSSDIEALNPRGFVGIANSATTLTNAFIGSTSGSWGYYNSGAEIYNNNANTAYGSQWLANAIIGVAFDADNGKLWFSINGTYPNSGNPAAGTNAGASSIPSSTYFPAFSMLGSNQGTFDLNFGQRPFAYTAPSGFKALVTTNLPDPTVVQGDDYFNTVLWTGDATNPRSISGVGFQPDLVWIKTRSVANPNLVHDAVRGVTSTDSRSLRTEATDGEVNYYTVNGALNAFESDGFRLAGGSTNNNYNASGGTFVAWNWKANGAGVSNTDGSITSTVSANTTAGISIVTYTGNGSAGATVGHGLGAVPSMFILKERSGGTPGDFWATYHVSLGNTKFLRLNTTDAEATAAYWNNTTPSSSVITLGSNTNINDTGSTYVIYAFAEVEGFSKFSSYTGNASTDGPFVYTGFRPAFVLIKCSTGSGLGWFIFDAERNAYNVVDDYLVANTSAAEAVGLNMDFTANGFKIRNNNGNINGNATTHIYMAFAENPFKYSLAR